MNFDPSQEDLVVNAINRRIATATRTAFQCGEALSILSYGVGQEYRPHMDALPAADNQRQTTALIYLNEDYAGGETLFMTLDIKVRGRMGDCLLFENATPDGRPDVRTRPAGLPVTEHTKWLASRSIRQKPYDPFTTLN
jgi:prolyl 4-hydroxylase